MSQADPRETPVLALGCELGSGFGSYVEVVGDGIKASQQFAGGFGDNGGFIIVAGE